jgi:hypothetical protein
MFNCVSLLKEMILPDGYYSYPNCIGKLFDLYYHKVSPPKTCRLLASLRI